MSGFKSSTLLTIISCKVLTSQDFNNIIQQNVNQAKIQVTDRFCFYTIILSVQGDGIVGDGVKGSGTGAVIGGVGGAVIGAVIGGPVGAAVGGAAGAAVGATVGAVVGGVSECQLLNSNYLPTPV